MPLEVSDEEGWQFGALLRLEVKVSLAGVSGDKLTT